MPVALSARSVAGSASVPVSLGPDIFGERLTSAHSRRGGPPSRYCAVDLCRALRKGIDPAQVTLARSMPMYAVSDEDCQALWVYLTHEP